MSTFNNPWEGYIIETMKMTEEFMENGKLYLLEWEFYTIYSVTW